MQNADKSLVHIVDGNAFICKFLGGLIESRGFEVQSFSDAEQYSKYVNSSEFRTPLATFVDIGCSSMRDHDMMQELQAIKPEMKFVVMSAKRDTRLDQKHLACMYLRKPLSPRSVSETLSKLSRCISCGVSDHIKCKSPTNHGGFYKVSDWTCSKKLATTSE